MRLEADFSALWAEVRKMSEEVADFHVEIRPVEREPLDLELSQGKEISLDDVEFDRGGLASIRGRQVLLYIPDHGGRVAAAIEEPAVRGNKFHVSFCRKLDEMRRKNRFERYMATNDLSGRFTIAGVDFGRRLEAEVELAVCKFCLQKLNYKGAAHSRVRQRVAAEFRIAEFFETYSSFFRYMPESFKGAGQVGYTADWNEVSALVRKAAKYRCMECRVDLSSVRRLLHVHHRNGVKSDNRQENLVALCVDCHRRQPNHERMHVPLRDTQAINRLRRAQSLLPSEWDEVQKLADPAVHGVLDLLRERGKPAPEIGYEVQDRSGAVIAELEAAWPAEQFAIVIEKVQGATPTGWRILTVTDFLNELG
jgi:hypothetical protein